MNKSNKYYTSSCGSGNGNFLIPLGYRHTSKIEEASIIVFGGGADIDPANYKEEPASRTWPSKSQESEERKDFRIARELGLKSIGICRGIQLLCTLAGGKLIQDVTGHSGIHKISTFDGITITTNSIHHQMINPYTIKDPNACRILAWSTKRMSNRYIGGGDRPVYLPWGFKEIESAYFPKIDAIGFQGHPEMTFGRKEFAPFNQWVEKTLIKFINNNL